MYINKMSVFFFFVLASTRAKRINETCYSVKMANDSAGNVSVYVWHALEDSGFLFVGFLLSS